MLHTGALRGVINPPDEKDKHRRRCHASFSQQDAKQTYAKCQIRRAFGERRPLPRPIIHSSMICKFRKLHSQYYCLFSCRLMFKHFSWISLVKFFITENSHFDMSKSIISCVFTFPQPHYVCRPSQRITGTNGCGLWYGVIAILQLPILCLHWTSLPSIGY